MEKVVCSLILWIATCLLTTGHELPDGINHPHNTTVVGQTVTIPCYSSNSNPVNWWYQKTEDKAVIELVVNGELINGNSERFSLNTQNYDLTLLSAKWTDSGFYTCVEDTAFGTRHITRLRVRARPRNVTATAGQDVTLVCNSSVTQPVNWWYKDQRGTDETEVVISGEVVNGNSDRMTLIGYNLVIHDVFPRDTGMYTCVENTGFGEHHKISLTVSDASATPEFERKWSTTALLTTQLGVTEDTSGQTLRTMSPAIISLAVVVPTCIIVGLVIAVACIMYKKRCRGNESNEDPEKEGLKEDVYRDPERFWEESLPKKVERSARRAAVKVKQNWRDICILMKRPKLRQQWINIIAQYIRENYGNPLQLDAIVGPDTKGFVFALAMAMELKLPYISAHELGDFPAESDDDVLRAAYTNARNTETKVEVHKSKFDGIKRVIFIDDRLRTGGSAKSAIGMLSIVGVTVLETIVIIEYAEFNGRRNLADTKVDVTSLVTTTSDDTSP